MKLDIQLDPVEARVFGVLVEKALTTPEQYPLTVNAVTNGCNQKSNRDPVVSLDEDQVTAALQRLEKRYLVRTVFPMNSRVEKYCHNGKDAMGLDAARLAVLAELLMRGPQSPGELRARVSRMAAMDSLDALMAVLAALIEDGYVRCLPPTPGSRAERYVQLLSPDLHPLELAAPAAYVHPAGSAPPIHPLAARVESLERDIEHLRRQLQKLSDKLGVSLDD
jgi:uncharacterized protein